MQSEAARIADQLRRLTDGKAWVGPNLRSILDEIPAAVAAARPGNGAHSIWEYAAHMTAWAEFALWRLDGRADELPDAQNFPVIEDFSEAAWSRQVQSVYAAHERLAGSVEDLDEGRLEETVLGRDYSLYNLLHGIVQHSFYHAGQIALLRRMLAASAG